VRVICIARVTDVILVASCNSASRECMLAGREVYRELICLTSSLLLSLNHDSKVCDTPKKNFILWLLLCKASALYLVPVSRLI